MLDIDRLAERRGWTLGYASRVVSFAVHRVQRWAWKDTALMLVRLRAGALQLKPSQLEKMTEENCLEFVARRRSYAERLTALYVSTTPNGNFLLASLRDKVAKTNERARQQLEQAKKKGILRVPLNRALATLDKQLPE